MEELEEGVQQDQHNRLYWIVHNLRTRFVNLIKNGFRNRPVIAIVVSLVILYLLFVSRGAIQPLILGIRKYLLLVVLLLVIFLWYTKRWNRRSTRGKVFSTVFIVLFTAFSYFIGPGVYKYLALYFHYSNVSKVQLLELPETDFERIQPLNSVKTLINQEGLSETEDATPPKFIRGEDGMYYYSCAVGPAKDYKIQQMSKNMYEIIHVPADLPSPVFSGKYRTDVNFDIGELLLFSKNTGTSIIKRFNLFQYLSYEASEPIYLENNGKWTQVVPLIKWKGILFPRPVFGGVFLINEKGESDSYFSRVLFGKGEYVSEDLIHTKDFLVGQNLIPKRVATFIAESFRFVNGFLAPMPMYHEGDIRIPNLPNDVNPQPFITYFKVDKEPKLYNFFGLEPYQENKKGLSLSLLIPGDNDNQVYFIDHRKSEESFIGSSAISSKIIESKKNYDWTKNYPAESRPYVRRVDGKNHLLWLSTIVTKAGNNKGDYIGGSIPEITLTDAVHGKVVWIEQDSLINNESWIKTASKELETYWERE